MQFGEEGAGRGGFQGRGFPRGVPPGRRGPDFREAPAGREEFKRPRWNWTFRQCNDGNKENNDNDDNI